VESHDSLSHGVVIERVDGGGWWHKHVVRGELEYDSVLLGRRTNLLFVIRKFGPGASRESPDFYITLDGEGLCHELCPVRFEGDWGERGGDPLLETEASHIRDGVVPLLRRSEEFQKGVAAVVRRQEYGKVAEAGRFAKISGGL
jgi:hypothetical protein